MSKPFKLELNESEATFLAVILKAYSSVVKSINGHLAEPPFEYLKAQNISLYITAELYKHYDGSTKKLLDALVAAAKLYSCSQMEKAVDKALLIGGVGFGAVADGIKATDPAEVILAFSEYITLTGNGEHPENLPKDDPALQLIEKYVKTGEELKVLSSKGDKIENLMEKLKTLYKDKHGVYPGQDPLPAIVPTEHTQEAHDLLDSVTKSSPPKEEPKAAPTSLGAPSLITADALQKLFKILKLANIPFTQIPTSSNAEINLDGLGTGESTPKDNISEEIEKLKKKEENDSNDQG
jgi:hypothetical protein